ncbi:MAG: hypothetical protein KDC74_12815 [Flavobacteriaceae bacterium]|nr:hypothetical protein [Flavobacteriaceae bacterium]
MDEEIKKFRIIEHYIASFCDERILSINFNPQNHKWTIVNIIDENSVFDDITGVINFLKHKDDKTALN